MGEVTIINEKCEGTHTAKSMSHPSHFRTLTFLTFLL